MKVTNLIARLSEQQTQTAGCSFDSLEYLEERCRRFNEREGSLNELDGYDCPVCRNRGEVSVIVDGEIMSRSCDKCTHIRKGLNSLRQSGLADLSFENYIAAEDWQKRLLEMGKNYVQSIRGEWFYIGGQTGAGKTHIATAVSRGLIMRYGVEVCCIKWREFIRQLYGEMKQGGDSALMKKPQTAKVLLIDDFLKTAHGAAPSEAELRAAFELIDSRYNARLVTIISSEFSIDEVIGFDEAVGGRVKERSRGYCTYISRDKRKNFRLK